MSKRVTAGQKEKFAEMTAAVTRGVVDSMVREGLLTREDATDIFRSGSDKYKQTVGDAVFSALQCIPGALKYVKFNYEHYYNAYQAPHSIESQIDVLRSCWPQLQPDAAIRYAREVCPTLQLPSWVEGSFVLIRPGFFSNHYGEELEEVLKALGRARGDCFVNECDGRLDSKWIRQSDRTLDSLQQIVDHQNGSDLLVVPEQFGLRHRKRCVYQVRGVMQEGEFGEGSKNVATMLITHAERLTSNSDLSISCVGDKCFRETDGCFKGIVSFHFLGKRLWFDFSSEHGTSDDSGCVSGFVP